MATPIHSYGGQGRFDTNNTAGFVGAMSVTEADFRSDCVIQIIYGDACNGFDHPQNADNILTKAASPFQGINAFLEPFFLQI